jgi:uncharacterized GH25 family protein
MLGGLKTEVVFRLLGVIVCLNGSLHSPVFGGSVTFKGNAVNDAGQPVAGAEVMLFIRTQADAVHAYDIARQTTVSDERGTFSFDVNTECEGYRYGFIVAKKGELALGIVNWDMLSDQEVTLTLQTPKKISGIVVDEDGRPVTGAKLSIIRMKVGTAPQSPALDNSVAPTLYSTQTDAEGRFSFGHLPPDASAELFVSKPGRASIDTFGVNSYQGGALQYAAGRSDIRITQPPEAVIEGVIVQKDNGLPVEGVGLYLQDNRFTLFDQQDVYSKSDGTFRFSALSAGQYLLMPVRSRTELPRWAVEPLELTVQTGQVLKDIHVKVSRGGLLEVQVLTADTQDKLEKANISIRDNRINQWFNAVSDKEGLARLRLPAGTYQLSGVYKKGFSGIQQDETIILEEAKTTRLIRTLTPSPQIAGTVRDTAGKPLEGVRLIVLPGARSGTVSDAQGRYDIIWDRSGWASEETAFCLVARDESRNLAAMTEISETVKTLDLELKPAITLVGSVQDEHAKPIVEAQVRPFLRVSNWGTSLTDNPVKTDKDGHFEINAVPAGARFNLYVSAEGFGKSGGDTLLEADDAKEGRLDTGTITLPTANLSISGRVVDTLGEPVAGAGVEAYGDNQPDQSRTATDQSGRFVLTGLCPGRVNLRVDTRRQGQSLSARVLVESGTQDIRIVARKGRSPVQYINSKTADQILQSAEKVIAGTVVNEQGAPVAQVPVGVCCHQTQTESGGMRFHYSSFETLKATTDSQGRFAIELEEDGSYNLLVSPYDYAAVIVYDVPVNEKQLKITLSPGGTVSGRLVRLENGQKAPVPNTEVKIEQTSRISYSHLGFDQDQTATTDAEGRFRFERLQTQIRTDRNAPAFVPRLWRLSHGDVSEVISFGDGALIEGFELTLKPPIPATAALTDRPLPGWKGITIDDAFKQKTSGPLLLCFWEFNQRPSRNTVTQLAEFKDRLAERNIEGVLIHAAKLNEAAKSWLNEKQLPFPIGSIEEDIETVSAFWGVQALPWLILTDPDRKVIAEGFSLSELPDKLEELK